MAIAAIHPAHLQLAISEFRPDVTVERMFKLLDNFDRFELGHLFGLHFYAFRITAPESDDLEFQVEDQYQRFKAAVESLPVMEHIAVRSALLDPLNTALRYSDASSEKERIDSIEDFVSRMKKGLRNYLIEKGRAHEIDKYRARLSPEEFEQLMQPHADVDLQKWLMMIEEQRNNFAASIELNGERYQALCEKVVVPLLNPTA